MVEALQRLEPGDVERALAWAPSLAGLMAEAARRAVRLERWRVEATLKAVAGAASCSTPGLWGERCPEAARLLWAAAGYLVVSDILVAHAERGCRGGEETDALAAYARYWLSELSLPEGELPRRVEEARSAAARLEEAVGRMLQG